ncbi:hypothetical protein STAL104432_21340 [Streptomyces albus]
MEQRPGHGGGHQGHDHHQSVQFAADHVQLESDGQDDDLGEPSGVHEGGQHPALRRGHPVDAGRHVGSGELPGHGGQQDEPEFAQPAAAEPGEIDLEPGDDEEGGQQQQPGDVFEAVGDLGPQPAEGVAGHDGAEQEGAEDEVRAHPFGGEAGEQQPADDDDELVGGDVFAGPALPAGRVAAAVEQPAQQGPDDQQHEGQVDGGQQHPPLAAPAGDGDDDGEQGPGQDVVEGGAGQGDAADTGAAQSGVGEDARQHGERGDGHGGAEEEHERGAAAGGVAVGEVEGEQPAQQEGQQDRAQGHAGGDASLAAQPAQVEFVADDEHEQHEAEVGERGEHGPHIGGEEVVGERAAEEGGADEEPGQQLADDGWLAQSAGGGAQEPAERQDGGQPEEEGLYLFLRHMSAPPAPFGPLGPSDLVAGTGHGPAMVRDGKGARSKVCRGVSGTGSRTARAGGRPRGRAARVWCPGGARCGSRRGIRG